MDWKHQTLYFDSEGAPNVRACLDAAVAGCLEFGIDRLVVFTGTGLGPRYVADRYLLEAAYEHLQVVAVTPPVGRAYRTRPGDSSSPLVNAGIDADLRDELTAFGIQVASAHLPFKEVYDGRERRSEWSRVAEAYGVFGGGVALCIQALLIATDAGHVTPGEKVVVASADTAFVAYASRTELFLSPFEGLLVEHILCRPRKYNISKPSHVLFLEPPEVVDTSGTASLPSASDIAPGEEDYSAPS